MAFVNDEFGVFIKCSFHVIGRQSVKSCINLVANHYQLRLFGCSCRYWANIAIIRLAHPIQSLTTYHFYLFTIHFSLCHPEQPALSLAKGSRRAFFTFHFSFLLPVHHRLVKNILGQFFVD
jgi:hypothetical protein